MLDYVGVLPSTYLRGSWRRCGVADIVVISAAAVGVLRVQMHGLAGSLRMKDRGSKKQVAVSFRPPNGGVQGAEADGKLPPVVFGKQGLEIATVELEGRENRRRRIASR